MREKKLVTYYCDYCKKHGHRRNDMAKHESICTLNPNRMCKVCNHGFDHSSYFKNNRHVFKTAKDVWGNLGCPMCEFSIIRLNFPQSINDGSIDIDLKKAVQEYYRKHDNEDLAREYL